MDAPIPRKKQSVIPQKNQREDSSQQIRDENAGDVILRKRQREHSSQQTRDKHVSDVIPRSGHGQKPAGYALRDVKDPPRSPKNHGSGPSFFTFVVDSSKPLGATAVEPDENDGALGQCTLWRVSSVKAGGQAETLGVKVGHYIYSLKGTKLKKEDDLMELLAQAKTTSDTYEIVMTEKSSVDEETQQASTTEGTCAESPSKSPFHTFDFATFSVIPTATGTDTIDYGNLRTDLRRRVRAVCADLCLLPNDKRPWLDFALNLVFSSLQYEAPTRAPSDIERPWLVGMKLQLKGPQPWMATRKFIVDCVVEMLEAEEVDWIETVERRQCLKGKGMSIIKEHLVAWKPALSRPPNADILETFAESVWNRFSIDHFSCSRNVSVMHRLTEFYVCVVANKLEDRGMCPHVPGVSNLSSEQPSIDEVSSRALITKHLAKLRFEVIPFSKDLDAVAAAIFQRLTKNFVCLQPTHISPSAIREILDDLEDDSNFLTRQNEMHTVRVKWSIVAPTENILFIGSDAASSGEDDMFSSNNRPPITASSTGGKEPANSGAGTSVKQDATRTETVGDGTTSTEDKGRSDEGFKEKTTRIYSSVKEVGARVYAEFTNGDYYWGSIVKISSVKSGKRFEVLFEDGDVLDNIVEKHIFTEVEYMKIFDNDPPEPQVTDRQKRRKNRSGSTDRKKERKNRRRSRRSASRYDKGNRNEKTEQEKIATAEMKLPVVSAEFMGKYAGQQLGNWSTKKLYKRRCNLCTLCTKPDCGLCATCLQNLNSEKESSEKTCLRKMCCGIDVRRKAQPAVGFSPGWMFYFEEHRKASTLSIKSQTSCPGLHIVSPKGQKYHSIEEAALLDTSAPIDVDAMCQLFRAHVGASQHQVDPNHCLVGKGYCHEWTDVKGRSNIIFGVIIRCWREGIDLKFTVDYNDNSLSFLNSTPSSFGGSIQRTQQISSEVALGGCIAFERRNHIHRGPGSIVKNIDRSMACKSWITPTMRKEEMVEHNGVRLPQLTLIVRGYKLVFSVKESTIPNAGYGVFVKCTTLRNDISSTSDSVEETESFKLKAGELLDLGVYATFRPEDKKHASVFNLKNYIFSMECEEWCFRSLDDDYMFDITNDKTGKVHDLAKLHIPVYVNECGPENVPTIHAEPDPEGAVHYLLGISYCGDWDNYREKLKQLDLKVGGDELEVFVNYGADYETVRFRKGYSIHDKTSEQEKLEAKTESRFVSDIDHYNANEVAMSVNFLLNRCFLADDHSRDKPIDGKVRDRALVVSRMLRARARKLARLREIKSTPESIGDEADPAQLIESSTTLIERLMAMNCHGPNAHETTLDVSDGGEDMDISSDDDYGE